MPTTSTPSREATPATAPSIASRWSPCASSTPPRSPPVPSTAKPSSVASIRAPSPPRPSTTAAIRSVSFSRSSCAPRTTVCPSAKQPSSATRGSSSIASGTSSGSTTVPSSGPWATSSSHTGSSAGTPSTTGSSSGPTTTPPIRWRIRKKPVRVQFAPMPSITIRERGTSTAAAARKAAEDGSPGTCSAPSSSSSCAATVIRSPTREIRTPAAASIRSVWSRLGLGSTTVVGPDASSPASSTHDFTCADATGSSYSIPRSGLPVTVNGGKRPSVASIRAPISAQRRRHAVDRPAPDRGVAVERPAPALLPGQPARQQPQQRAGVADVDRLARRRRRPQARRRAPPATPRAAPPARPAPATAASVEFVSAASR